MKEIVLAAVGSLLILFLLIGGIMVGSSIYADYRAEKTKERCLAAGMNPVPWGSTYYCR